MAPAVNVDVLGCISISETNPLSWLQDQRIRRVQELLENTSDSVEIIARLCGFGSATTLRRQFRRALDTTPDAYRRTFRGLTDDNRSHESAGPISAHA